LFLAMVSKGVLLKAMERKKAWQQKCEGGSAKLKVWINSAPGTNQPRKTNGVDNGGTGSTRNHESEDGRRVRELTQGTEEKRKEGQDSIGGLAVKELTKENGWTLKSQETIEKFGGLCLKTLTKRTKKRPL